MQPVKELIGNIAIDMISEHVNEPFINQDHLDELEKLRGEITEATGIKATHKEGVMHPVEIIETMQKVLTDDTTVIRDGKPLHLMARKYRSYNPRHLLFSNGMQTPRCCTSMGYFSCTCTSKYTSCFCSGDGGFLFSGQELETAVRKT